MEDRKTTGALTRLVELDSVAREKNSMAGKIALPFDAQLAIATLSKGDPRLARLIEKVGEFAFQLDEYASPYESLLEAIVYQSISGKAAAKIFSRIQALGANGICPTPAEILKTNSRALRAAGLRAQKLRR